ncbi:MAG: metal-dependent transcriptional regulator [Thermomicrobiales bacterium]|nr:metal-dependent transcriptional regulator [Thermomicrobiales bacterium]
MDDGSDEEGSGGAAKISSAASAYLQTIYLLSEDGRPATTQHVAWELGVASSSVTNMFKRLSGLGLLVHTPYRGATLTESGVQVALQLTRRCRLLELYLVRALGYHWDEVQVEANRLARAISDELTERIEVALGYPTLDPHGDPIPSQSGMVVSTPGLHLLDLVPGLTAQVCRVSERDAGRLRYLGELGLAPGNVVEVLELLPFDGPLRIKVAGREQVISRQLATDVLVETRRVSSLRQT